MSVVIDIDNFPSLSSVLRELEKREKKGPPSYSSKPVLVGPTIDNQVRRPRSFTAMSPEPHQKNKLGRRGSDPTGDKLRVNQSRLRLKSTPCPSIDPAILEDDTRLTENSKKLSNEELALLYEDVLKPLDFNSILFERMKLADFEEGGEA